MTSILDLIAILYIVVLSFIFCTGNDNIKNSTNKNSCLLSHIVIGLSVIVFYKLARYFKLQDRLSNNLSNKFLNNTENFDDSVTDSINNFIKNSGSQVITTDQASKLSPTDLSVYSSKLDSIINSLNSLQKSQNTPDPLAGTNPANLNSLDLTSQQQYQMFQLDYLNKQIKNAQDVINAQSIADSNQNYKPIKVFSSCVISNANGTTTVEKPVSTSSSNSISTFGDINLSPNTQQMLNTISQSNGAQLSPQSGIFQTILSNLNNFTSTNITN
jgi:hypothetical protein